VRRARATHPRRGRREGTRCLQPTLRLSHNLRLDRCTVPCRTGVVATPGRAVEPAPTRHVRGCSAAAAGGPVLRSMVSTSCHCNGEGREGVQTHVYLAAGVRERGQPTALGPGRSLHGSETGLRSDELVDRHIRAALVGSRGSIGLVESAVATSPGRVDQRAAVLRLAVQRGRAVGGFQPVDGDDT
jgi:hypothetical protein